MPTAIPRLRIVHDANEETTNETVFKLQIREPGRTGKKKKLSHQSKTLKSLKRRSP
ncbi:MAG: hypothetical protein GY757_30295 [bacterium]|nr:hypothetical protein [bacterium]